MPFPIAVGIGVVFSTIIVPLVVKVFLALGVGFVTYTGAQLLIDTVLTELQTQFASAAFDSMRSLFAYMNVDKAITMMVSAITIRATLRGLQAGGSLRKLSFFTPS